MVLAIFESNQNYFAKELCEQKKVASNSCQGHCQFRALLINESESEEPMAPSPVKEIDLFEFAEDFRFSRFVWTSLNLHSSFIDDFDIRAGFQPMVWRPPC